MSSTSIYGEFKPTYLYIKQHTITGLLYFGKTIQDPVKYLGSGTYWLHHIKKHSQQYVITLWYDVFDNRDELIEFAEKFSLEMNIVKSNSWANLTKENGVDGHPKGYQPSDECREKLRQVNLGKTHTEETKKKIGERSLGRNHSEATKLMMRESKTGFSNPLYGKHHSDETKEKMRNANLGREFDKIQCPHCSCEGGPGPMKRWHFDNCRYR